MTPFTVYSNSTGEVLFCGAGSGVAAMHLEPGQSMIIGAMYPSGWIDSAGDHHDMPDQPSAASEWDWVSKSWNLEIEKARADAWRTVKSARNRREFGPFSHLGLTYDGDESSQRRINLAVLGAQMALSGGQSWSIDWTLADNSVVTLTAQDMVGVAESLGASIAAAHQWARELRVHIAAANSVEEIDALVSGLQI